MVQFGNIYLAPFPTYEAKRAREGMTKVFRHARSQGCAIFRIVSRRMLV